MIQSFGDDATQDVFRGRDTRDARRLPRELWARIRRKLDVLSAADEIIDSSSRPGNRLEALKGDRLGTYCIRVNDQYRITFRFESGDAFEVKCEDYH